MKMGILVKILLMLVFGCVSLSVAADATTVKAVYVGGSSSYAVDANGSLWVWGAFQGQGENYVHPTRVSFIDHVVAVAPSSGSVVVLKDDGTVWAWGPVSALQNGSFQGQNSSVPVRINISDVKSVVNNINSVYMVKTDGSLWMCGSELSVGADDFWRAVDGHREHFLDPVCLPIDNVSRVEAGMSFVYAERDDGSWWAWGENSDHQLCDGTNMSRRGTPAKIQLGNIRSVCLTSKCYGQNDVYISRCSVLALTGDGRVYGWGDNFYSVAGDSKFPRYVGDGDGREYVVSSPYPVPGLDDVVEVGRGSSYYVALKRDGSVWAWGDNFGGSDWDSALNSNTPVKLSGFSDIVSIVVCNENMLAVKKDGTVWAWGNNQFGQLGNGEISAFGGKPYAVQVADLYVELPSGTNSTETSPLASSPAPGFGFSTMALLGCLFMVAGLLSVFLRKDL
jgi:alpha-tubulin suppressor-like RCC1 family protein